MIGRRWLAGVIAPTILPMNQSCLVITTAGGAEIIAGPYSEASAQNRAAKYVKDNPGSTAVVTVLVAPGNLG